MEAVGITYMVLSVTSSKPYWPFKFQCIGRLTAFFKLTYTKSAGEKSAKHPPSLASAVSITICYGSHFSFGKGKESHVCSQLLKVQVFKGIQQVFVINITQSLINCVQYKTDKPQIAKLTKSLGLKTTTILFFFKLSYLGHSRNLLVDLLIGDISGSICSNLKGNLYQLFWFLFCDSFPLPCSGHLSWQLLYSL